MKLYEVAKIDIDKETLNFKENETIISRIWLKNLSKSVKTLGCSPAASGGTEWPLIYFLA
jgi:hypothetical protein